MPIKMNIDYNPSEFRVFKPQLVGIYRSDTTPVSNNANDLYLRYVSKPLNRPLELEKGFMDQPKKTAVINNKFESLLEWIALNKQLFQQLGQQRELNNNNVTGLGGVDFVASTGTLSFLLKVPYELENNFSILAEMLNGTIYLKIKRIVGAPPPGSSRPNFRPSPATNTSFSSNTSTNTSFSCSSKAPPLQTFACDFELNNYCDQKFRQHFTEKINASSSSNNENVNFQESKLNDWVSFGGKKAGDKKSKAHKVTEKITFVFRTKVKKHNIIFSDEVDSFEQIHPANRDHFGIVKFKLVKKGQADRNEYLNSLRKLRWWSICVFSSVRRLVVGFWSQNHVVEEVREYTNLNDLKHPLHWNANVCFNNLNSILSLIRLGFSQLNTSTLSLVHQPHSKELLCVPSNLKVLPSVLKDKLNA